MYLYKCHTANFFGDKIPKDSKDSKKFLEALKIVQSVYDPDRFRGILISPMIKKILKIPKDSQRFWKFSEQKWTRISDYVFSVISIHHAQSILRTLFTTFIYSSFIVETKRNEWL